MTDGAADRGTRHRMMARHVPCDSAYRGGAENDNRHQNPFVHVDFSSGTYATEGIEGVTKHEPVAAAAAR
jgi:hypothetical protein